MYDSHLYSGQWTRARPKKYMRCDTDHLTRSSKSRLVNPLGQCAGLGDLLRIVWIKTRVQELAV